MPINCYLLYKAYILISSSLYSSSIWETLLATFLPTLPDMVLCAPNHTSNKKQEEKEKAGTCFQPLSSHPPFSMTIIFNYFFFLIVLRASVQRHIGEQAQTQFNLWFSITYRFDSSWRQKYKQVLKRISYLSFLFLAKHQCLLPLNKRQ